MKISAVVFDLSGTLSDDRLPVYEACRRMVANLGGDVGPYEKWIKIPAANPVAMMKCLGIDATKDDISRMFKENYEIALKSGIKPFIYPFVEDALARLQKMGIKMYIVSAHPKNFVDSEILSIKRHFVSIVGGCIDKTEALREICSEHGLDPAHTAYVGDTVSDMIFGKKVGMITIAVLSGYQTRDVLEKENPDFTLEDVSQLPEIIKQ